MKLVRFGDLGTEKPGLIDPAGHLRDLTGFVSDIDAECLSPTALSRLAEVDVSRLPFAPADARIGCPIAGVPKIVAVGLNYLDHVKETGLPHPQEPLLFQKSTTAICGPFDDVVVPRGGTRVDWEVELAVVIGTRASYVSVDEAPKYIAGYCIMNDVSERSFQMDRGGQFMKGKCCDTFAPIGPWLVTCDEVLNPQNLDIFCDVNGQRMQHSNTNKMIFQLDFLVSYISQFLTLLPGDVVSTGTPAGTGIGLKPQRFLKAGDRVRLGITGLGEQLQRVVGPRGQES